MVLAKKLNLWDQFKNVLRKFQKLELYISVVFGNAIESVNIEKIVLSALHEIQKTSELEVL